MNTSDLKKYHGLYNHGATCYLNSVLQVLFMTRDFREAVQRLTNNNPEFIDRHLKDLFDDLRKGTARTKQILETLHIQRVYEQCDAAEYLEKILRLTSPDAAKIFHGELSNTTTCSECRAEMNRDGMFWYLPLPLVDSCSGVYSVEDGLEEFFKTSDLNGENQMYCEQCDTKVNAKRKNVLKHPPDVLILLLKRFDFSYRYMSFVKINSDVDVPNTVEVSENQKYELYAVVEHFGDLRSGHYVSAIKDQDDENKWFCFNDTTVTQINPPFLDVQYVKSRSAYLLFYRKKETGAQESMVPTNGGSPTSACENYNESHDAETERRTQEHEHEKEVSVDTVAVTDTISVSKENELSSDHKFKTCHPEVKAEQVDPELSDYSPEGHVREQDSDKGKVQTEHKSLHPSGAQLEVQDPENLEIKEVKPDVNLVFTSVSERSPEEPVRYKQGEITNAQKKELGEETVENEETDKSEILISRQARQESSNDGQNINEYYCGTNIGGEDDGIKPVNADKEGDVRRMQTNIKDETEGKIQVTSQKGLLTIYGLYLDQMQICHRLQNKQEDKQKHEQGKREKEDEGRVDIRGLDHDVGQNKSGQRNSEGVEKLNKKQGNEENTDPSQTHSGSEIRERQTWSQGAGNDENIRQDISKLKARSELQGVTDGHQSSKQPGDECIIAERPSEAPCGGKRNQTTKNTETAEETSQATTEKHERNNEGNVNENFDITNNVKASSSTAVSNMKLRESPLRKQENYRTKGVTDEQMEAARIINTLKKRGLKKRLRWGHSGQRRLAAYRERKRLHIRKYLGVFLYQKDRRARIRIQRHSKRKSAPV
ncbi:ubiquitin carboxyl-terminal hydrolase 25-like isoform X2 [Melanotaenia boesemani]|uniref:ubiquitin carboxyl-terminal hydrolase 25-like isoform X2 n=1 Tax=Melanotaenia boesemani TaxID=1250792 RepID=UPI001C052FF2|nr:ubiquitin carboxyl-terminal hydrolase 25-like isoform X2 [Melanotaenia boesemani]XP_041840494.1 ubiquitin carboxyl-terminal hydrolase 25-like isoform X2 [Melanotaenia boesemani]